MKHTLKEWHDHDLSFEEKGGKKISFASKVHCHIKTTPSLKCAMHHQHKLMLVGDFIA